MHWSYSVERHCRFFETQCTTEQYSVLVLFNTLVFKYLTTLVTLDLYLSHVCVCHDRSSPGIEGQDERSRSNLKVKVIGRHAGCGTSILNRGQFSNYILNSARSTDWALLNCRLPFCWCWPGNEGHWAERWDCYIKLWTRSLGKCRRHFFLQV